MSQLPADCLNEIFEYLENDKVTLHSCLLVNRLWCEVSVRILWRNVLNFSTLIASLPNESKENLCNHGITISIPASKPMFNYAAFCKTLSIVQVEQLLRNQQSNLKDKMHIVAQELYKLFMSQISSLKTLIHFPNTLNIAFTSYPGAKNCLRNLSELHCCSVNHPGFFYWLSTICHNIQTLNIIKWRGISSELSDLISVQQNLKYLTITAHCKNLADIFPSFPNTLIKFKLALYKRNYIQFSFMAKFTNLEELSLSCHYIDDFGNFEQLQYPQLQILKFNYIYPRCNSLIKFLENNGKNLKELYVGDKEGNGDDSLNLAIAKFCPNLRKLSIKTNGWEKLKIIFNSCQHLESIKILCGRRTFEWKRGIDNGCKIFT